MNTTTKPAGFEVSIEVAPNKVITRRWRQPFVGKARAMAMRVAGAQRIVKVTPLQEADFPV